MAALVAVAGCGITLDERMLLPGSRYEFRPITDAFARKNIDVEVQGGVHLRGWYLDNPTARRIIVYYYGNGGRVLTSMPDLYALAEKLEASVLCVDYRGYGFSDGTPSFDTGHADAVAVFDRAADLNVRRLPIFVLGWSLGTSLATHVASVREVAGAVLLAPPTSATDMAEHFNDRLPWFASLLFTLEPAQRVVAMPQPVDEIARVDEPVLVVHGTADEIVPFRYGKRMYEAAAASSDRAMCVLEGAGHGLSYARVPALDPCVQPFLTRHTK